MLVKAEPVRVSPCRPRGTQGPKGERRRGKPEKEKNKKKKKREKRKRNGKMTGG
jgi:hypothetical protein